MTEHGRLIKKAIIPLETAQANRRHRELQREKKDRLRAVIEARKIKGYGYKEVVG